MKYRNLRSDSNLEKFVKLPQYFDFLTRFDCRWTLALLSSEALGDLSRGLAGGLDSYYQYGKCHKSKDVSVYS